MTLESSLYTLQLSYGCVSGEGISLLFCCARLVNMGRDFVCAISKSRMPNSQICDLNLALTLTNPNPNPSQIARRILLQIAQTHKLRSTY